MNPHKSSIMDFSQDPQWRTLKDAEDQAEREWKDAEVKLETVKVNKPPVTPAKYGNIRHALLDLQAKGIIRPELQYKAAQASNCAEFRLAKECFREEQAPIIQADKDYEKVYPGYLKLKSDYIALGQTYVRTMKKTADYERLLYDNSL